MSRTTSIERKTKETRIRLELSLDGQGKSRIETGIGFFDHMLNLLTAHGQLDLTLSAGGDLQVDDHHLIEDAGIVIGQALREVIGGKEGIERYGSMILPMDEVLVACAIDLSGRALFVSDYAPVREAVGDLSTEMVNHFFRSLATEARMNLHFRFLNPGENEHHRIEAMFKSFARALRTAVTVNPQIGSRIQSTKGMLD